MILLDTLPSFQMQQRVLLSRLRVLNRILSTPKIHQNPVFVSHLPVRLSSGMCLYGSATNLYFYSQLHAFTDRYLIGLSLSVYRSSQYLSADASRVTIGDVSKQLREPQQPQLVPTGYCEY